MVASKYIVHPSYLAVSTLIVFLTWSDGALGSPQAMVWPDTPEITALRNKLTAAEQEKGRDSPELVPLLTEVAKAYRYEGGFVPAAAYMQRVVSINEKTKGPKSLQVGLALDALGTIYRHQGDTARARAAYSRALPIIEKELGPTHAGFKLFMISIAELHLQTGNKYGAQTALDAGMKLFNDPSFQANQNMTDILRRTGVLLLGLGNYQYAERQLMYALTVRSEALSFDDSGKAHLYIAPLQNALGGLYVTVGLFDKAEPLLQDALNSFEARYGKEHPLLEDIIANVVALYDGRHDAPKKEEYSRRLEKVHQNAMGYRCVENWPVQTALRVAPVDRSVQSPFADARMGDEVIYDSGEGVPLQRLSVITVTPVVAVLRDDRWDTGKKEWAAGREYMRANATTVIDLYGEESSEAYRDTVTIGGKQIGCRTFFRPDRVGKAKWWIAPGVVPVEGLVKVEKDGKVIQLLREFKRGG